MTDQEFEKLKIGDVVRTRKTVSKYSYGSGMCLGGDGNGRSTKCGDCDINFAGASSRVIRKGKSAVEIEGALCKAWFSFIWLDVVSKTEWVDI